MFRDMFMFRVRDKGARPCDLRLLGLSVDVGRWFRGRALEERHRQNRQDTLQARQLKQCRCRQDRGKVKQG